MSKIKEYFKKDEIKLSFGLGFCIILLAIVSKKILHNPISYLENAAPVIVFIFYEVVKGSKADRKYKRPLYWNLAMIAASVIIILIHINDV